MADNKNTYSAELKIEVARKAIEQDKKELEPLSQEYEVPVSLILTWAAQYEQEGGDAFAQEPQTVEDEDKLRSVELSIPNQELEDSLVQGVMTDDLNYKRLVTWSVIGLILVLVFMQMLVEMFQIRVSKRPERIAAEHAFYKVTHKKKSAKKELSSFGVMNEKGTVFKVPIDMVIEQMAEQPAADTSKKELLKKIDPTPIEK